MPRGHRIGGGRHRGGVSQPSSGPGGVAAAVAAGRCRARGRSAGRGRGGRAEPDLGRVDRVGDLPRPRLPARPPTLAATSSSSGPRWRVRRWMTRSMPRRGLEGRDDPLLGLRATRTRRAAGSWSRWRGRRRRPRAGGRSSRCRRRPSSRCPVSSVKPTASRAKTRPSRAARSSSRITGSSGALARLTNSPRTRLPRTLLVSVIAVRNDRLSSTIATTRTTSGTHHHCSRAARSVPCVDLVELVVRLVEGEQTADAEQHDRDDEGVDVALAAVAERVLRVASRRDLLPPSSSSTWLPVSATEWIASASIELTPVSKNAMNLVTAMPVFASSAATTALVPPSVDMRHSVTAVRDTVGE